MSKVILGLDIGGANLKAVTSDGRAVSVPFAVWKHPEQLGDELAKLIGQFPEAKSLAVTMTAELCDCYETKREGVNKILDAVVFAAKGIPFQVWSTAGRFVSEAEARANHMAVAAANWHALATFAGRFVPQGIAILIDIGSTTTDIVFYRDGVPITRGLTDVHRMKNRELVYMGVRRTPACMLLWPCASEFFATSEDAYIVLGLLPERHDSNETADNRPATIAYSRDRLSRIRCGDRETLSSEDIENLARSIYESQVSTTKFSVNRNIEHYFPVADYKTISLTTITSGEGEFVANTVFDRLFENIFGHNELMAKHFNSHMLIENNRISLNKQLGPTVSACAPAHAIAVLAAEARA
ncbi:hydantoinase/oxoprolinase family protein [soil metagenome]